MKRWSEIRGGMVRPAPWRRGLLLAWYRVGEIPKRSLRVVAGLLVRMCLRIDGSTRCPEYCPDCPCCDLWKASDVLLHYGSDREWTLLFHEQEEAAAELASRVGVKLRFLPRSSTKDRPS